MSAGGPGVWSPLHRQRDRGAGGETQRHGGTRGSCGSGPRPPEGSDKGGSREGTCTEKPSARVSGRGLAARDEGLGCPGDSGMWGALECRLWLPQTPPHQAAGARHRAFQGWPPFLAPSRRKEEPVTLRPVCGSVERHRCAGRLWADALRVSTVLPSHPGASARTPRPPSASWHGCSAHPPAGDAGRPWAATAAHRRLSPGRRLPCLQPPGALGNVRSAPHPPIYFIPNKLPVNMKKEDKYWYKGDH